MVITGIENLIHRNELIQYPDERLDMWLHMYDAGNILRGNIADRHSDIAYLSSQIQHKNQVMKSTFGFDFHDRMTSWGPPPEVGEVLVSNVSMAKMKQSLLDPNEGQLLEEMIYQEYMPVVLELNGSNGNFDNLTPLGYLQGDFDVIHTKGGNGHAQLSVDLPDVDTVLSGLSARNKHHRPFEYKFVHKKDTGELELVDIPEPNETQKEAVPINSDLESFIYPVILDIPALEKKDKSQRFPANLKAKLSPEEFLLRRLRERYTKMHL